MNESALERAFLEPKFFLGHSSKSKFCVSEEHIIYKNNVSQLYTRDIYVEHK